MSVSLQFFQAGFCRHIEALCIRGGKWKLKKFPALVTLIHHPDFGYYLFDTGYSHRFFEQTQQFPEKIYSWITPVTYCHESSILSQLQKIKIHPEDIQGVILSHFHADHIAGLKDFTSSKVFCLREGYEALSFKKTWHSLTKGFLPGLLPSDLLSRLDYIDNYPSVLLEKSFEPFKKGYDLFGDRSLIAVPLPGHAKGQIGLLCKSRQGKYYFLVADACWDSLAYSQLRPPHLLANLITDDVKAYQATLKKLNHLNLKNPNVIIVPSHCNKTLTSLNEHKSQL